MNEAKQHTLTDFLDAINDSEGVNTMVCIAAKVDEKGSVTRMENDSLCIWASELEDADDGFQPTAMVMLHLASLAGREHVDIGIPGLGEVTVKLASPITIADGEGDAD